MQAAIGYARLMRESTAHVEAALHAGDAQEVWIARRVLESSHLWQQWEAEHALLMRQLAERRALATQRLALKETTLRLLHGTALFHFMRVHPLTSGQRERLVAHFRPGRSYDSALIAEHGSYLRKACSYLCTGHLGREVVADPDFLDPMPRYEELYTEYFEIYCRSLLGGPQADSQQALLPLLKKQLGEYRQALLDPKAAQPFLKREAQLRRTTGDTARMPTLGPRSRR